MEVLENIVNKWKQNPQKQVRVIGFGSSNTESHWHSLGHFNWFSWLSSAMREGIGRHVTTINQGINGETAEDLIKRIERDVLSFSPDAVIVTIGGNDAIQNCTVKEYTINLQQVINRIQTVGTLPILQTYYCPIYERMPKHFAVFQEIIKVNRILASKNNIPLIDQYKYFSPFYENDPSNYSKLMLDGLHVNPLGNAIMGIIACRHFYLPDPLMLDRSFKREVRKSLSAMRNYCDLPPVARKKT